MLWIRLTALYVYFMLASLAGLLLSFLRPFNPNNNALFGRIYAWGGQRALGVRLEVEGREHLQGLQGAVILANHQHNLDMFMLGALVPARTVVVGKASLRWLPLFGQIFWLADNVLIKRGQRDKALAAIEASREALVTERKNVWIFPEGTRNGGRQLRPFKKGAFHAAIGAQAPLVMICVSSYPDALAQGRRILRVRVLPPVSAEGMSTADMPTLIRDCEQRMAQTIAELDAGLHWQGRRQVPVWPLPTAEVSAA
ncbi:MAG: 1-acyl-sn-glycerol-3-phosphate acyltransferase [Gammaproteobacteria bacterium]|nr:1-acyl-sn-glycerol-3-phosphate acyltransferase [Gammaproteobacteria bacterium]